MSEESMEGKNGKEINSRQLKKKKKCLRTGWEEILKRVYKSVSTKTLQNCDGIRKSITFICRSNRMLVPIQIQIQKFITCNEVLTEKEKRDTNTQHLKKLSHCFVKYT
jgi:hypothetical protein